jgi:acetyl/propionyl-CoA carboxylase alpha subunit
MFRKILIANRGVAAVRIAKTCRKLHIKTASIYTLPDKNSIHIAGEYADERHEIDNYLNLENIIKIARKSNVDAIHPGYGFRAEDYSFAKICEENTIPFIGPSSKVMEKIGNKLYARRIMKEAGLTIIPGTTQAAKNTEEASEGAEELGYPVVLKPVYGGGGKGMHVARDEKELKVKFETAESEAATAFARPEIYLEKYFDGVRHIEFQFLADSRRKSIHLGERECSLQRRHQKLLEECPSPNITAEMRKRIGTQVARAVSEIEYVNAGTMEFLMNRKKRLFFLEINKRLQVEHRPTEMVYGLDLVEEQLRIADGEPLSRSQTDVKGSGAAMNLRIYAEDASKDFQPSPGRVTRYVEPEAEEIVIDSALYSTCTVPVEYDSLIANVAVHGRSRRETIGRARRVLDYMRIDGIETTATLHRELLRDRDFIDGKLDTGFIPRFLKRVRLPIREILVDTMFEDSS